MLCHLATSSVRLIRSVPILPLAIRSSSTAASLSPEPHSHTPLFLRPLTHTATAPQLHAFQRWAKSLSLSHPDPPHLDRELTWLLQDASSDPTASFLHSCDPDLAVRMRVEVEELYGMWRERVEERRPFQYLVGNEHWRDLVLVVKEGVLIPRPETEAMVDLVMKVPGFERGWWADLGTGSGSIAVGIARALGDGGRVFAVDFSPVAVEVAQINVERYGLKDKVEVRQGSWFEPLQDVKGKLSGVISNPPYIPSSQLPELQAEVRTHEPWLALDGGEDGLCHLLHLCEGCISALKPGGFFAFETDGDEHTKFISDLMSTRWRDFFHNVNVVSDFAGINRFVTGFRN